MDPGPDAGEGRPLTGLGRGVRVPRSAAEWEHEANAQRTFRNAQVRENAHLRRELDAALAEVRRVREDAASAEKALMERRVVAAVQILRGISSIK